MRPSATRPRCSTSAVYVGDVTGDYNGVVTGQDLSEGRSGAQLLADAIAAARKVDAVVFIAA